VRSENKGDEVEKRVEGRRKGKGKGGKGMPSVLPTDILCARYNFMYSMIGKRRPRNNFLPPSFGLIETCLYKLCPL